jgi:Mg2+/Co2+ transporter CorC
VPIFSEKRTNIVGILLVKGLLFVNLDDAPAISQMELREIPTVEANKDLYEMLNLFQTGRSKYYNIEIILEICCTVVAYIMFIDYFRSHGLCCR